MLINPTITLLVGPDEQPFHVHRDIACSLPFFEAALKTSHSFSEAVSNTIKLPEDDVYAVSVLVSFLYNRTYEYSEPHKHTSHFKIRHANVYLIADKYHCPELKDLVQKVIDSFPGLGHGEQLQYWEYVY